MKIKFANPYMTRVEKISAVQRLVVFHSYMYYEGDEPIISDKAYDSLCRGLYKLMRSNIEEAIDSDYWYVFEDWVPSTGFDLWSNLTDKDKWVIKVIRSCR